MSGACSRAHRKHIKCAARKGRSPTEPEMDVAAPFLFLVLASGLAAYHRWRLATWAAFGLTGLLA